MMDKPNVVMKELLNDCYEKADKVKKLLDDDSKNDPATDPYFSKYKARSILTEMLNILENILKENAPSDITLKSMVGGVLLQIGIIDMETEELANSEIILNEAETFLRDHSLHPQVIIVMVYVYNYIGILWSNRDDPEKAKSYLLKGKELYENFKCTLQMPIPIRTLFGEQSENVNNFTILEKAHTLTLYYLAQMYGSLKLDLKSAIYYHITLRRQLQYNDYEPIDWALNTATLSQFFSVQNGFFQSRHHLAAASIILKRYKTEFCQVENGDEQYQSKLETFNHRSADVALCWSKYCLNILSSSKHRLMSDTEEPLSAVTDMSNLTFTDEDNICDGNIKNLIFEDLDVSEIENTVSDKYALTYEDARKIFICCQNWLNSAKEYYSLDSLASDYIKIVQDHSRAFKYLAFFEEDDDRRAKIHKKRINIIDDLLKEINPTYYMEFCRQLWYELGKIYTDMLNIKLERLEKCTDQSKPQYVNKINILCEKSIESYDKYLDSLKDPKTGIMPSKLEDSCIVAVISSYASIGRNNLKKITIDKNVQFENLTKSYEGYKSVVDISEKNENAIKMMNDVISLCKEMINILPLRILKLRTELSLNIN